jgi:hypothetical protein
MTRDWPKGSRVRIRATGKLATVRNHWRGLIDRHHLVTVSYDDGSPPDIFHPDSIEAVR